MEKLMFTSIYILSLSIQPTDIDKKEIFICVWLNQRRSEVRVAV